MIVSAWRHHKDTYASVTQMVNIVMNKTETIGRKLPSLSIHFDDIEINLFASDHAKNDT